MGAPPTAAAGAPLVEIEGVHLARRGVAILEDVSLTVREDDYLALLGPNGGGKTMLLRVMLGLVRPDRGRVRVLGGPPEKAHGRVGYVPQHVRFDLDFPIRVLDVVQMGRLARRGPLRRFRAEDRDASLAALERVEMAELAQRPIGALSGGQRQRVLIARALAMEPRILLMDEPMASLDERMGRSLWELLETLSHQMALVLVSHDIGAISRYVRSVACLNVRLHGHPARELSPEVIEAAYGCPVELLAHGHPHRVLAPHGGGEGS
jgi:zinc transport system ATP-binding protein